MPSQIETDYLLDRIKILVRRYGGQSAELADLRHVYQFWQVCPADNMAYVLVKEEVEELEHGHVKVAQGT
jgi:hypothetical protein